MICEREISERKGEKGAASCFVSQVSWGAPFWEELSTEEVIYYFHNDHLGTPQLMTDDQGVVVWKATYKPFGEVEVNSSSTVVNNLRFPGQCFDEETGLHYNYLRYYHPDIGRYSKPDPLNLGRIQMAKADPGTSFAVTELYQHALVNPATLSLYTYCLNRPIHLADPEGLLVFFGWSDIFVLGEASKMIRPTPTRQLYPQQRFVQPKPGVFRVTRVAPRPVFEPAPDLLPQPSWLVRFLSRLADLLGQAGFGGTVGAVPPYEAAWNKDAYSGLSKKASTGFKQNRQAGAFFYYLYLLNPYFPEA